MELYAPLLRRGIKVCGLEIAVVFNYDIVAQVFRCLTMNRNTESGWLAIPTKIVM